MLPGLGIMLDDVMMSLIAIVRKQVNGIIEVRLWSPERRGMGTWDKGRRSKNSHRKANGFMLWNAE